MEPYSGQYKKNLIFRKQMSEKHPSSMVAEQNHKDICQKPNAYFTSNKEEKMEINWTNLTKRLHFHHLTSPSMDTTRKQKKEEDQDWFGEDSFKKYIYGRERT